MYLVCFGCGCAKLRSACISDPILFSFSREVGHLFTFRARWFLFSHIRQIFFKSLDLYQLFCIVF